MTHFLIVNIILILAGMMLSSASPPTSTPLEPCRVGPYMNMPALRSLHLPTAYDRLNPATTAVATTAYPPSTGPPDSVFPNFDPALLSAAHQVPIYCNYYTYLTP